MTYFVNEEELLLFAVAAENDYWAVIIQGASHIVVPLSQICGAVCSHAAEAVAVVKDVAAGMFGGSSPASGL
jgi:hypothetical protein